MTDTTRTDFEAFIIPKILADYNLPKALHCFENGEYENDWIQVAWRSYETGAQAATRQANQWMPIADAPRGRKLIVGYKNKLGNWRTVMASYYKRGTLECENDDIADEDGYAPEGWYEESESQEIIVLTDEVPTHFMPLPLPPTGTGGNV